VTTAAQDEPRWRGAWLDGVAFAGGLALAWFAKWQTTDLVWSLWLSSLVVGYSLIVWNLSAPLRQLALNPAAESGPRAIGAKLGVGALLTIALLFGLAFFTVHFGGFHFVHSVFLSVFFPLNPGGPLQHGFPNLTTYAEVVRRYWIFLPVAFLAERAAFSAGKRRRDLAGAEAIAPKPTSGDSMMEPYKNVMRMHLLIFFFAFARFARWENFAVYAVVYAVYFFPWRMVRTAPSR